MSTHLLKLSYNHENYAPSNSLLSTADAHSICPRQSNRCRNRGYVPFEGEKTTWHEGFDRFDFIMDDATGAITPIKAPASEVTSFGVDESVKDGKRRCVVVVPKKAAPGNPWSWRGCYWNHQPQSEVELLRRGFHIAFVAPDPGRQGKAWDAAVRNPLAWGPRRTRGSDAGSRISSGSSR